MNFSQTAKSQTNHLTNLCLSFLTDKILKGFDDGILYEMTLIDLQKAFGTINHKILLKKLEARGIYDGFGQIFVNKYFLFK